MAIRNKNFENDLLIESGRKPTAKAWVYTYRFDTDNLGRLKVREYTLNRARIGCALL
jgi:hypothetical protein